VYGHVSHFPKKVKHVVFGNYYANFPNIENVETVYITHFTSHMGILQTCPKTITELKFQSFYTLDCSRFLPNLPALQTLYLSVYSIEKLDDIYENLPNITTLHIKVEQLNNIENIYYFKHRLIIESFRLITTGIFAKFQTRELDLSRCENIQDYSGVAHIPIVKRYENK
jgi:Leucine-rich repeat (LRR) protein